MRVAAILVFTISMRCLGQTPEVPNKIHFAGMTLTIRDDARREIQKDVDAFTQSPRHFNIKVDRAKTYFPIIERIFAEERVPEDFKFLVIQESALIADAVSTSNAVGFWQFKDFTAIEMGLRVDNEVDERMNIVSASRAAAKYIKKNNFYFNNWLYALQAYQMGAGGVMQQVKDYESGTKHMEITSRTYWYVKKFLAHKIAYEHAIKGSGKTLMLTVENRSRKSLSELAKEFALDEDELKSYNKWVRKDIIPGDKVYAVMIPSADGNQLLSQAVARANEKQTSTVMKESPKRVDSKPTLAKTNRVLVNGIPAVKAEAGETIITLAKRAEVDLSYFLKCNDISISDGVITGEYYFIERKNSSASKPTHTSVADESLWSISQKYGVQLKKLTKYNKAVSSGTLQAGTIVLLSNKQRAVESFNPDLQVVEVSANDVFSWSVKPEEAEASAIPNRIVSENQSVETPINTRGPDTGILPQSATQHTIIAGETLYSIAKRYGVNVMDLVEWNNLNLEAGIKTGQVLVLRNKSGETSSVGRVVTESAETLHEVKASDTLYSVARKYGVTIKEIMDWNQKKDFSLVQGEKLRIIQKP